MRRVLIITTVAGESGSFGISSCVVEYGSPTEAKAAAEAINRDPAPATYLRVHARTIP